MKKIINYFKDLYSYIKDIKEINHNYGYAIKEGFCSDESYNWRQRLHYYMKSEAYDPDPEDYEQ